MPHPHELTFQKHIADFLIREHKYGELEQIDITDTENFVVEDHLWAFLKATQSETIQKLTEDYGTDAREEVFRALRNELRHTPLWLLIRSGLGQVHRSDSETGSPTRKASSKGRSGTERSGIIGRASRQR